MKRTLALTAALAVALGLAGAASATTASGGSLTGAGSTFVFPLVSTWIPAVSSALGITITYGPIGSGGGISSITARTVDFGTSDAPLSPDQYTACKCVQIPWALSATSIAYHVDGVPTHLRLTSQVLAGIFMGKITKWNDRAIASLNPGFKLPDTDIVPIHRSDNSGTTYNFTDYLQKVSAEWRTKIGRGVAVNWPGGLSGKGSSGVAAVLSQTNGGITYVDVAYSLANHFSIAAIQNRAGNFELPGLRQIAAAAATIQRVGTDNYGISIVEPARSQPLAYPICTFTYVILPTQTAKAQQLRQFVNWALTKGQAYGPKLLFQPIPPIVLRASLRTLAKVHS